MDSGEILNPMSGYFGACVPAGRAPIRLPTTLQDYDLDPRYTGGS